VSKDKDRILGHAADNDGIEEYDNALPDWWLGLFAFTVVWGIGYAVDYHFIHNRSQASAYDAEMAAAKEKWPQAQVQALAFDDATVKAGGELFQQTCVTCHGAELTGGIGPNLVDATWIHGGEAEQIRTTITNGVPDKGMPTWGPILGPDKIAKLTAFVYTKSHGPGAPAAAEVASATPGTPTATDAGTASPADETGEQIFKQNCVVCHGENLEGKVGPNLTDNEWIHGGKLEDIEHTITVGVPEKGMVTWGPILGPDRVKKVAEFVHGKGQSPQ
jgi:cytochrome c oxidase cbb3-type subunit 3